MFNILNLAGDPNYFYKWEIDISGIRKYNRLGIDVVGFGTRFGKLKFSDYLLTSDVITEGRIVTVDYFPDPSDYFHSKYTIKVTGEGFLTDDSLNFNIYSTSGPIGDTYNFTSHQVIPDSGEEAIFFLRRNSISELEEAQASHLLPGRVTTINIDRSKASISLSTN